MMTRESFDELFRRPLHFLWLSSFLVSSQIYAGAGKVGSENGAPACSYQLSQRGGDFFHVLMSWDTMYRRGLINERDEAHAGRDLARLHCIYYDSNLLDFATYLKVGALQLAIAMLEAGYVNSSVLVEDPVAASQIISHSLGHNAVRTFLGERVTALDLQYRFLDAACKFVEEGLADGVVPEADTIISRWVSTLDLLRTRDTEKLSRRLDWVAKLRVIDGAVAAGRCEWDSPQAKMLDHAYSTLDEEEGLFLALEHSDVVDRLTDEQRVIACLTHPPESTRAYTRGRLMLFGDNVIEMDWDRMKFLLSDRKHGQPSFRTFDMSDPLLWSKEKTERVFANAEHLEEVLNELDLLRPDFEQPYETGTYARETSWTDNESMTAANSTTAV
jgi:proteasome accessory factor A